MPKRDDQITVNERILRQYQRQEPEAEFQASVIKLAHLQGWIEYHDYDSRRSTAGFPDLTLLRVTGDRAELLFAELKRVGETPTAAQRRWLGGLQLVDSLGIYLWDRRDWDEIERALARRRDQ